MIKLTMRGHVLSLFSREHIEKVLVGLRDDFGKELCLVSRKGLRVQSGHWSRLVADSSQGCDIQVITGQLDINGVYLFTRIYYPLEGSRSNQTDGRQCLFTKEFGFRVTKRR